MALDTASQSFNTGPPNYSASRVTAAIESVDVTESGMEVLVSFTNTIQNGRGFFPTYTVTATADGETRTTEIESFPNTPAKARFSFPSVAPVEVEANPGRDVDSLILSAEEPPTPSIQPPEVTAEAGPGTATVQYTVANDGSAGATVDLEITASGPTIETATTTQTETVPPGREVSGKVTFEFDVDSPTEVELCVRVL